MQLFEVTKNKEAIYFQEFEYVHQAFSKYKDKVFLLIDDNDKVIWIFKGENSPIIMQFVGCYLQELMRKQLKEAYRKRDLNLIPKNSEEYIKIINSKITSGKAREILKKEMEQELTEEQKKIKEIIEESRAKEICVHKGVSSKVAKTEILKLEDPEGFRRHFCFIGADAYIEREQIKKFLTKNEKEKTLIKIGTLPNGFFFLEDVSSRLLIMRGSVYGLDIMIEKGRIFGSDKVQVPLFYREDLLKIRNIQEVIKLFKIPNQKA